MSQSRAPLSEKLTDEPHRVGDDAPSIQAAKEIRSVLIDRLERNYGDTIYVRAKALSKETGWNETIVGHAFMHYTGDWHPVVDTGPLSIDVDRTTHRSRYEVTESDGE